LTPVPVKGTDATTDWLSVSKSSVPLSVPVVPAENSREKTQLAPLASVVAVVHVLAPAGAIFTAIALAPFFRVVALTIRN
jgi:hypothetical protein